MANQSVRVQLSAETKAIVENLAENYGCLYGGKPHISGLLAQIADGRLVLNRVNPLPSSLPNIPLLKLRLWFPEGLRGGFAQVADKIAFLGGNIFQASVSSEIKSSSEANIISAEVLFSMPEDSDLSALITVLQSIKIKDVIPFNKVDEILEVIPQTKRANLKICSFNDDSFNHGGGRTRSFGDEMISNITEQSLLLDIACTIGIKLIAQNQVGTLSKVTREIAEQGFFISAVKQSFDSIKSNDIIELLLTLHPKPQNAMPYEIQKVSTIMETLQKIPAVKLVQRLGVDYL
jgi:hypothetical protein